ncbi:hypothetical protein PISMIDRAFT_93970, partial [Pisolithus microcarpus 441]
YFLIVGGGITSLAYAPALRRIGQSVVVLGRLAEEEIPRGEGLLRNVSKILFQWGHKAASREFAVPSPRVEVVRYDSGDLLGTHIWEDVVLQEVGGEYLFYHVSTLLRRKYLH